MVLTLPAEGAFDGLVVRAEVQVPVVFIRFVEARAALSAIWRETEAVFSALWWRAELRAGRGQGVRVRRLATAAVRTPVRGQRDPTVGDTTVLLLQHHTGQCWWFQIKINCSRFPLLFLSSVAEIQIQVGLPGGDVSSQAAVVKDTRTLFQCQHYIGRTDPVLSSLCSKPEQVSVGSVSNGPLLLD